MCDSFFFRWDFSAGLIFASRSKFFRIVISSFADGVGDIVLSAASLCECEVADAFKADCFLGECCRKLR